LGASRLLQSVSGITVIIASLGSTCAWAEIYKWVDEKGGTVYSNVQPAKTSRVKNLEVVVEDEKISEASASAAAARREQELLDRIGRLERQLQAQPYPAPLPPPPPEYYPGSYYPGSYYPSTYYPAYYPYVVLPARFVAPARRFGSPRFASGRVSSFHRGGMGRGRR
jgi:hypothetical protein